eukprot:CAMPEP_0177763958 /NCGR_PEP_ID=MMETSP0491_2-20121128/7140_1 /TAXON_ID=63592 /ORGANISM="Tetraselmis chuii, Strain PLY429" /LENGTH=75 /DNA_ID=CAMNT_0019280083 /DNA_START=195 /DNA_END=419 /DNA_ORIENTATION=-
MYANVFAYETLLLPICLNVSASTCRSGIFFVAMSAATMPAFGSILSRIPPMKRPKTTPIPPPSTVDITLRVMQLF